MKRVLIFPLVIFIVMSISFTWWQKINTNDGSLSLVGCEYPQEVNAGDSFDITFYMMALEPIKKECSMFIHLYSRKMNTMINADAAVAYPVSKWKLNDIVKVGPIKIYFPNNAPSGDYSIEAGLFWAQETALGTQYNKLPYLNYLKIQDWKIGRFRVVEAADELLAQGKSQGGPYVYIQDSLNKVFPEKPFFLGEAKKEILLNAAKNEFESAQVSIVATDEELKEVKFVKSDFIQEGGKGVISKDELQLFLVEYVNTKKPYYNTSRVGLWPDPLMPISGSLDIEKGKFKTVWLQAYVPKDALAGRYSGKMNIVANDKIVSSVKIILTVWDFVLPEATHLKTAFDLKESILDKYYSRKQNETESNYIERLEFIKQAYCLDMLKHRLNPIHNVGNPKFLGKEGGIYKMDFLDFDKRVNYYLKQGQKIFSIGDYWPWQSKDMWGKWYGLKDESSVLSVFSAYGKHLEKNGWIENAYAYIFDETFFRVKEVTALIHQAYPGIKNLLTMAPNLEYKDIDIWCPRINNFDPESVEKLKTLGKQIWIYVAGTTRPYPNLNLDVSSIEYRILPWICWKFKIEGLLYWAVNWWVDVNPWESAMTFPKQNGNGCLYYPGKDGPVTSIRLEVLRDGMEDYELLYLLKTKIEGLKKRNTLGAYSGLIQKAEEALKLNEEIGEFPAYYTHTPEDMYRKRLLVAQLIEEAVSLQ